MPELFKKKNQISMNVTKVNINMECGQRFSKWLSSECGKCWNDMCWQLILYAFMGDELECKSHYNYEGKVKDLTQNPRECILNFLRKMWVLLLNIKAIQLKHMEIKPYKKTWNKTDRLTEIMFSTSLFLSSLCFHRMLCQVNLHQEKKSLKKNSPDILSGNPSTSTK